MIELMKRRECRECHAEVEPFWFICPTCGKRLRAPEEILYLIWFWLFWVPLLTIFFIIFVPMGLSGLFNLNEMGRNGTLNIGMVILNLLLICIALIATYWMAKSFIKSVSTQISLRPLKLRGVSFRAVVKTLLVLVILPGMIFVSASLLLFAICAWISDSRLFP